jgi:hypothetical protein
MFAKLCIVEIPDFLQLLLINIPQKPGSIKALDDVYKLDINK